MSSESRPVTSILAAFRSLPHSSGDTTFDYGSIGRGFKSLRAHQKIGLTSTFLRAGLACFSFAHILPTFGFRNGPFSAFRATRDPRVSTTLAS